MADSISGNIPQCANQSLPRGGSREGASLNALGKTTQYRMDYAPDVLETFVNKHQEND